MFEVTAGATVGVTVGEASPLLVGAKVDFNVEYVAAVSSKAFNDAVYSGNFTRDIKTYFGCNDAYNTMIECSSAVGKIDFLEFEVLKPSTTESGQSIWGVYYSRYLPIIYVFLASILLIAVVFLHSWLNRRKEHIHSNSVEEESFSIDLNIEDAYG